MPELYGAVMEEMVEPEKKKGSKADKYCVLGGQKCADIAVTETRHLKAKFSIVNMILFVFQDC